MSALKDQNHVGDVGFWKKRLEDAKGVGLPHASVYQVPIEDMRHIDEVHKGIIDTLINPEDKVLDAGCAYGRYAQWFRPEQYIGVDFSPDFIAEARITKGDFNFTVGDLTNLDFAPQQFDWAVCISIKRMVEFYLGEDKWVPMERELKRVAKKVLILEYTDPSKYEIL